ncbi:hypothetical protein QUF70_15115 [Desulfobacterales bacterium HSG17]|nr:hypothetical protein [Desulfobacterales bacterium HSG17]
MRHSQEVHKAMQKAFKELLALDPQELRDRLKKRETGTIGYLMRDTGTIDFLYKYQVYEEKYYYLDITEDIKPHRIIRSWQAYQESDDYIITETDMSWLEAA